MCNKLFGFLIWFAFGQGAFATPLYLFGGGHRPKAALESYVQKSGGNILVVTWATNEPDLAFAGIESDLLSAGAIKPLRAPHQINSLRELEILKSQMKSVNAIFFTGGDQNLALEVIEKYDIKTHLQKAFAKGMIFAGTSAGTALMPIHAMRGGGPHDLPELREGLGLIPYYIDQHFIVRDREMRLKQLVIRDQILGIGVDEGMCALVEENKLTAFGPTEVQIFIPKKGPAVDKVLIKDGQQILLK